MKATDRSVAVGSSRFLLAVRAIAWLAEAGSVCSSSLIADSVHAQATFLRRLFAPLVRSGVVEAREGRVGGYALARSPDQITLADIYQATMHFGDESCPASAPTKSGPCEVRPSVDSALEEIFRIGESRFTEVLSMYTIADLLRKDSTAPFR